MDLRLDEAATRRKVIELLNMKSQHRMDMWIFSGVTAGVLDSDLIELCIREEIPRRDHEVQRFWLGQCNCHGQVN